MKKLITSLILFACLPIKALALEEDQVHKLCLEARDYKGCVNANKNLKVDSQDRIEQYPNKEKCWGDNKKWCIAKEGKDFFGMQKITGWTYLEDIPELSIWYFEAFQGRLKFGGLWKIHRNKVDQTQTIFSSSWEFTFFLWGWRNKLL